MCKKGENEHHASVRKKFKLHVTVNETLVLMKLEVTCLAIFATLLKVIPTSNESISLSEQPSPSNPDESPPTLPPEGTSVDHSKFPAECGKRKSEMGRIFGGEPAAPGAWPWMAAVVWLQDGIKYVECGATLVSWDLVLTAAHCVIENETVKEPSTLLIHLGEHNIEKEAPEDAVEEFNVKSLVVHEKYGRYLLNHDIALLKLDRKVTFSERISPACLPFDSKVIKEGDITGMPVVFTGWGRMVPSGPQSDVLRQVSLAVVDREVCRSRYPVFRRGLPSYYLCAGVEGNTKHPCGGDSGGPLVMVENNKHYIVGIFSFIKGHCGGQLYYTPVFARVAEFLDWIKNKADELA